MKFDMVSDKLESETRQDLDSLLKRFIDKQVKLVSYSNKALEKLMLEAGYNQSSLSKASGVNQANISNFISGKSSPREEDTRKLGRALNVVFISDWLDEEWEKETPRYKSENDQSTDPA